MMTTAKKKRRLKNQALKLWFRKYLKDSCEICLETYLLQGHHYYYRSSYGYLMFDKDNHITLCKKHHFVLHHQDPKGIESQIAEKRGKIWLKRLKSKSKNRPQGSYLTLAYYKSILEELK